MKQQKHAKRAVARLLFAAKQACPGSLRNCACALACSPQFLHAIFNAVPSDMMMRRNKFLFQLSCGVAALKMHQSTIIVFRSESTPLKECSLKPKLPVAGAVKEFGQSCLGQWWIIWCRLFVPLFLIVRIMQQLVLVPSKFWSQLCGF